MDSDGLTILIPAALVAIFFIVALIMSRKSWKFFHILCCFLLFVGFVFLMGLSAMALKTRLAWSRIYNEQTKQVKEEKAKNIKLKIGDQTKQKETEWDRIAPADMSLADVQAEKFRVTRGLGRVWRHCSVTTAFNGSTVTIRLRPDPAAGADPNAAAPAAPANQAPHSVLCACKQCKDQSLPRSNKLWVFKEVSYDAEDGSSFMVPGEFLGEFQVSSDTPDSATLTATMVVNPLNYSVGELQAPSSTWAVYDTIPADGHDVLQGSDREQVKTVFPQTAVGLDAQQAQQRYARMIAEMQNFYRNLDPADRPDQATLQAKYPADKLGLDAASATDQYNRFVDSFVYDLTNLNDIPADSRLTNDQSRLKATPQETWVLVKFLKAQVADEAFEVDSPADWDDDTIQGLFQRRDRIYDTQGKAIIPLLRQGGKTEFARDDEVLLDQETATDLESRGIVEPVARIFVRKLNQFPYLYREIDAEGRRLQQKSKEIQREYEMTYKALKAVQAQIAEHEVERDKLIQDRDNFRKERDLVIAFEEKLKGDVSRVRSDTSRFYNEIVFYESLLAELDRRLRKDINARVIAETGEE